MYDKGFQDGAKEFAARLKKDFSTPEKHPPAAPALYYEKIVDYVLRKMVGENND